MTDLIITATVIYMAIFILAVYYSFKELASKKYIKQSHGVELIHEASQEIKTQNILSIFGRVIEKEASDKRDRKTTSITPIHNWLPDKYVALNIVTDENRLDD
ncbi:MAG: hypothetical protein ACPGWR_09905 [Ardenticatenaceae bacterium]